MYKITNRQIENIQKNIASEYNDAPGECNSTLLSEIASSPYDLDDNKAFYLHPSVYDKAAHLAVLLSDRKPFEKYNIKTAIVSLLTLLDMNKLSVKCDGNELSALAELLESKNKTEEDVLSWLDRNKQN